MDARHIANVITTESAKDFLARFDADFDVPGLLKTYGFEQHGDEWLYQDTTQDDYGTTDWTIHLAPSEAGTSQVVITADLVDPEGRASSTTAVVRVHNNMQLAKAIRQARHSIRTNPVDFIFELEKQGWVQQRLESESAKTFLGRNPTWQLYLKRDGYALWSPEGGKSFWFKKYEFKGKRESWLIQVNKQYETTAVWRIKITQVRDLEQKQAAKEITWLAFGAKALFDGLRQAEAEINSFAFVWNRHGEPTEYTFDNLPEFT